MVLKPAKLSKNDRYSFYNHFWHVNMNKVMHY
jgi:hypothetical protein